MKSGLLSAPPQIDWTPSQRSAIRTTGTSVLVSAGAGSGKTAVLAERCAYLAADARPACPVDRMLVVTFTEAAATQMRERIGRALRKRLANATGSGWVTRQLAMLNAAPISTIHAFCKRTLDRYFAQAGVDPGVPILDEHDAALLRRETVEGVFDRFGDRRDRVGKAFLEWVAAYGAGREGALIDRVLAVDAFLTSVVDPDRWLEDALARFAPGESGGLSENWLAYLRNRLAAALAEQRAIVEQHLSSMSGFLQGPGLEGDAASGVILSEAKDLNRSQGSSASCRRDARTTTVLEVFAPCLEGYRDALADWEAALGLAKTADNFDALLRERIGTYKHPAVPRDDNRMKALPAQQRQAFDRLKEICKDLRENLHKKGLVEEFTQFTCGEWAEGIARTQPHAAILATLVKRVRKAYRRAKLGLGVVDFSDLERMTLDLLQREETYVAARLRDRYDHVLVDEFQDTNPIQAEILRLISRESDPSRPGNLFAVGDVKQSIYRFRLAEPKLFLERRRRFTDDRGEAVERLTGVNIDLVENFRSRPEVIETINAVFERLMTEDFGGIAYDEHARLKAGKKEQENPHPAPLPKREREWKGPAVGRDGPAARCDKPAMELHILDDRAAADDQDEEENDAETGSAAFDWERIEREAYVIGRRIVRLKDEGIDYGGIVVLMRSMAHRGPLFVRTLSRMGIPTFADVAGGFFDSLEIRDMLALLALLDNEQQDIPLAAVLRSPVLGTPLTDTELVEIRTTADGGQGSGFRVWGSGSGDQGSGFRVQGSGFHQAVVWYADCGRDLGLRGRLSEIRKRLARWREEARRRPLADVFWEILDETGYLAYVSGLPEGPQRRANLIALHERARQFGTFHRHGLYRFLRFIEDLMDADQDLEPGSVAADAADVVRVMSIHRSKGLEFPVVFVAEMGKQFNQQDARGAILFDRRLGLGLQAVDVERRIVYPTLPHRAVARAVTEETLAEELRILYVALTRAEQRLVLVGTAPADTVDKYRQKYISYAGPLPLLDRRRARGMLQWVLAAVCCQDADRVAYPEEAAKGGTHGPTAAKLFSVTIYPAAEMKEWIIEPEQAHDVKARLERCRAMAPLEEAGALEPLTAKSSPLIRRLMGRYAHERLCRVPAVAAASELKGRWRTDWDPEEPAVMLPSSGMESEKQKAGPWRPGELRPLIKGAGKEGLGATGIGTATHLLFEHVDLRGPCDENDLRPQLNGLVDSGILTAEEAGVIDLSAAAWFFMTDVGRRLRRPETRVHREWPFVLRCDPRQYDPAAKPQDAADIMLVRGTIDCLFDAGDGWEVLDYKTDAVQGPAVTERAALYRGQVAIYAEAIESAWGAAPMKRWLAFLTPREIIGV